VNYIFIWIFFFVVALIIALLLIPYPSYRKQIDDTNKRIRKESRFIETKNGILEFAIRGNGKPALLIHGAGGGFDHGLWLGKICLDDNYMLIAPSKFSYLNSQTPEVFSAKIQAEQYKLLLDYLEIDKVLVIGLSAGGPSAMQFANDYPERVEKLVLLSAISMPLINNKFPLYFSLIQLFQESDYAYWLFTNIFRNNVLNIFGISVDEYRDFSIEQKELAVEMLKLVHPISIRNSGTLVDSLIIQDFNIPKNIIVPSLIIHCKNDGLLNYSHSEHSHKNIMGSKIILYERGGHGALSVLNDLRVQIKKFLLE
jgi:pimeloyl-ACP methyl ester carboxylesterase